jgi:Fe-S cluster assembly scaffold protein SufB
MQTLTTNNWTIRIIDNTDDVLHEQIAVDAEFMKKPKNVCTVLFDVPEFETSAFLKTADASFEQRVIYVATGDANMSINVRSTHDAIGTSARMIVHGIALGKARVNFTGSIDILKGAAQTDGELRHAGMLLSPQAKISALPGFEIHSNDVKAAHSSAVYYIRPEQLFYLQSRGIDETTARRMIVEGFLFELLPDDMPEDERQALEKMVIARIGVE